MQSSASYTDGLRCCGLIRFVIDQRFTPNDPKISLLHLGNDEKEALNRMKRLTDQHMYIISLKELQYCFIMSFAK